MKRSEMESKIESLLDAIDISKLESGKPSNKLMARMILTRVLKERMEPPEYIHPNQNIIKKIIKIISISFDFFTFFKTLFA